jgi:hypothetical protein
MQKIHPFCINFKYVHKYNGDAATYVNRAWAIAPVKRKYKIVVPMYLKFKIIGLGFNEIELTIWLKTIWQS